MTIMMRQVSSGNLAGVWTVSREVKLSLFYGSTLVTQLEFDKGNLEVELPAGTYSCIALLPNFYAYFLRDCSVLSKATNFLGDISLSPELTPGTTRAVLSWGSTPKDLDTYVSVPSSDPARPSCLVMYKSKTCNAGASTQVSLDLDSTSHNQQGGKPETITFGIITPGRYIYRVQVYKGVSSDALLSSGAVVTVYSEDFQMRYKVGRDGYIEGINWFVFYVDGATMEIKPCDRVACPTSVCAAGGWRKQDGQTYLC